MAACAAARAISDKAPTRLPRGGHPGRAEQRAIKAKATEREHSHRGTPWETILPHLT
jgi:hypothetical protein